MRQMTQYQQFQESHRHTHSVLQEASWLAGLMGDNPNPMTQGEVEAAAKSDKPYAWAFQMIVDARKPLDPMEQEILDALASEA